MSGLLLDKSAIIIDRYSSGVAISKYIIGSNRFVPDSLINYKHVVKIHITVKQYNNIQLEQLPSIHSLVHFFVVSFIYLENLTEVT
jgi:hypothetical protein